MPNANRPLKVFLSYAHEDKAAVRDLYRQLCAEGWMDVWLDEEKLLPGQEWDLEIEKAVEEADIVLVILSTNSVDKEGYVQKELRFVLNLADQKPEGAIFVIPVRLNECPVPRRLRNWQYVDYFPKDRRQWAYGRILQSLKLRAGRLGISTVNPAEEKARLEAEERARREAAENARKKEQEERSRKAAEEMQRQQAEEKARREGEEREKKAAEQQARKPASESQPEKVVQKPVERKTPPGQPPPGRSKPARRVNFLPFGLGGILVLVLLCAIIGISYLASNWSELFGSTPAEQTPAATFTDTTAPMPSVTPTYTRKPPTATPTQPGIGSTWTRPADEMVMVYVPEGNFTMGSDSGDSDEKPVHTVYLDAFWIDQTEVTNKMYALCVAAGKCDSPDSNSSYTRSSYYGNSEFDDYPVIYVSWDDASAYCAWAGARLPTEAEWEKAARGDDGRTYPWGEGIDCPKANYGGCVGDTSRVGSYESGKSPYGAYDLAGNVWEWVNDWYGETYYSSSPLENPTGPASGTFRLLRGGSWHPFEGYARSSDRVRSDPDNWDSYIGFRCSRSP